jgi:hypothetical protein
LAEDVFDQRLSANEAEPLLARSGDGAAAVRGARGVRVPVLREASLVTRTARLCHRRGGEQAGPEVIRYLNYWAPQADEDGYLPVLPERARLGRYRRRTGLGTSTFYADQASTVAGGWIERVQAPGGGGYTTRYRLRLVPEMVPADPPPVLARDLADGWEQQCARLADDPARHTVLLRPGSLVLVDADGVERPRARQLDGAVVHPTPPRLAKELLHTRRTGQVHRRVKGRLKALQRAADAARQPVLPAGEVGPGLTRFEPTDYPVRPLPESGPDWFMNAQVETGSGDDRLETCTLYMKEGSEDPGLDLETTFCSWPETGPTPPGVRHPGHAHARGKTWRGEKGRGKGPRASSGKGCAPVSPSAIALLGEVMGMWIAEFGSTRVLWVPDAYDLAHVVPGPPVYGIDRGPALRLARLVESALERTTEQEVLSAARAAGASTAVEPVRTWARRLRRICRDLDRAAYRPQSTPAARELAEWLTSEVRQFRPVPADVAATVLQPLAAAGWTRDDLVYWLGIRPLPAWYIQATSGDRTLDPWQLPAHLENPLGLLTHRCSGLEWRGFDLVADVRRRAADQARTRTKQWSAEDEHAQREAWKARQARTCGNDVPERRELAQAEPQPAPPAEPQEPRWYAQMRAAAQPADARVDEPAPRPGPGGLQAADKVAARLARWRAEGLLNDGAA